jgi:CRP-like cAMP-binding protein
MRGRTDYLDHLAQVPMFSACSKKDLQTIGRASDEVGVPNGKVLVQEGKPGHEFFLILDGTASVSRNGRRVAQLGQGQYFGELALLDRGPRSATVTADSDMQVLVLGQREFAGVLDEVPGLARKMLAAMAGRLRDADAKAIGN